MSSFPFPPTGSDAGGVTENDTTSNPETNPADERYALAAAFQQSLLAQNWQALRALFTDDATWTLPGDNKISGRAEGADAVVDRVRLIAGYGVNFDIQRVLVSRDNLALSVHNTANREGVVLDEYLATVCFLRDGKIAAVETYVSDLPGMNAFFV